jgi:hypothetical protein
MIRKFIDSISTRTMGWIALIPAATIIHLLWKLCIGPASGILICIQALLLAIQVTALMVWMRRN